MPLVARGSLDEVVSSLEGETDEMKINRVISELTGADLYVIVEYNSGVRERLNARYNSGVCYVEMEMVSLTGTISKCHIANTNGEIFGQAPVEPVHVNAGDTVTLTVNIR